MASTEPTKFVMGRIVGQNNGRPVVQIPIGPPAREVSYEPLIKAARAYKDDQSNRTLKALAEAAIMIDGGTS